MARIALLSALIGLAPLALISPLASGAGASWRSVLSQPRQWYASAEAERIADNVLAYQHPNGGWPKNIDKARVLSDAELTAVRRDAPRGQTIIDNGATHTEVRFLARVSAATGRPAYRDAALRGVDFLLDAQYPGGGWPMIYPLRRGYYTHITYNDGAMVGVLRALRDAAAGEDEWSFVDSARRARAADAVERGVQTILATQIRVDGKLTAWCAQHDEHTLAPAKARAYELPSISGQESVGIVEFLMEIPEPSDDVVEAVESAVDWFRRSKVEGVRVERTRRPRNSVLVEDPDARPLWARFYDIPTNRPMYVGRDGVPLDGYNELELERRLGYSYLGPYAERLLAKSYPRWRERVMGDE
ncbi:Pectic acid lyase [Posidoniimonas polymericola]|uniref:Pectic acid lyase n=1 Tax=Posidoniimonas polymericola TaxID=2528002 RepID=A0A5C5ZF46_9BACT|nr:pectate lyase [Posidoniimonas polymericola]TWT85725.1 Pectic acid lyase [Posidoniimonas polymericola]